MANANCNCGGRQTTTAVRSIRLAIFAAALAGTAGCQTPGPRLADPTRAVWVTRFDYRTADDVVRIMDDCKRAGLNTVVFQVRGNGTAFYRSRLEPWAEELGGKDPGFDPLELACREAHARDMQLHAWVNVMPAWRGTKLPKSPNQLLYRHPEWFWYDQHGDRQQLSDFYVSLNPSLPEVRRYIVSVFREIVAGYDVDGLHLDYVRFPNEPPATPRGSDIDYSQDARTLAQFKRDTGHTPESDPDGWKRWRAEQVTKLVSDIKSMIRWTKPHVALTAAVGSKPEGPLERHYRDSGRWAQEKLIDAVFPMNYHAETFNERAKAWAEAKSPVPVVTGINVGRNDAATVAGQIDFSRGLTPHFCLFAYSALFDRRASETAPAETQPTPRSARSAELIEKLQAVADSDGRPSR